MTRSPTYGGAARALPGPAAGNDSTLVGAFLPRQSRLSARIAESSLSTIASSIGRVEAAMAAAKTAFLTMVLAVGRFRHPAERTVTSTCPSICGGIFGLVRLRGGALLNPLLHPLARLLPRPWCRAGPRPP